MYIEKGGEMKKGGPGNLRGDLRPLMKPCTLLHGHKYIH